ncbi:MAG: phosphoadenosine phosphosulfate reductase family protein [Natronospirillum sp.]|uniref:phosphoadenosine phosphosulfate reductase domain-containing protein n=1 Tax=Natronospirillum sp. TaxID=2812955 RepID=UPI0025CF8596|nr:phosphoadenosine phosphosulfate reductase family protein [Natronospirillum sp.]MCH8552499.1 phosphoadenosine phosphosulfate reductase family protein [Natronospirillum sp.]
MAEQQHDLFYSADSTVSEACSRLPFPDLLEQSILRIERALEGFDVLAPGVSYGKDSGAMLALCLEAVRRYKARTGVSKKVVVLTADTRAENPKVTLLAHEMSSQMLAWARAQGLDVQQRFVMPRAQDAYLVSMIGGKGIASTPSGSSACTIDLKKRPMDLAKRELSKHYGAGRILTLIGTRYDESQTRGERMRGRGERFDVPYLSGDGQWMLSPIADWTVGDVWQFLNGAHDANRIGFETFSDFVPTIILYEGLGESTCSIGAVDPTFGQAGNTCSGGRTGCWICQKVSRDHSLWSMLDRWPELKPLVMLSEAIRAGHDVRRNRTWLTRAIDADGCLSISAGAYSPEWQQQLLRWVLSVDMMEDRWSENSGKPRRFPPIMDAEQLLMIGFFWARYGVQKPGSLIRIIEEFGIYFTCDGEIRYTADLSVCEVVTEDKIQKLRSAAEPHLMKRNFGRINVAGSDSGAKASYFDPVVAMFADTSGADGRSDLNASAESSYVSGDGRRHDVIGYADHIAVDLAAITDPAYIHVCADFIWWWAMEFADGSKSSAQELQWLVQTGVIRAGRGYQSQLADAQLRCHALGDVVAHYDVSDPNSLRQHPAYVSGGEPDTGDQFDIEDLIMAAV